MMIRSEKRSKSRKKNPETEIKITSFLREKDSQYGKESNLIVVREGERQRKWKLSSLTRITR